MGSSVGLKRKTVPFVTVDEKRELPFTVELEIASLFTLAEARRGGEPLSTMARVYYPLHIHRWEGRALLIDLLGLNHTSIRYNIIPDMETFEKTLKTWCEEPDVFLEALKKSEALVKGFAGQKTVKIKGLVQPKKDVCDFLKDMCDLESMDEPMVFKPVLKHGDIESIIDSLCSLRDDIDRDLKSLKRAKSCLKEVLYIARKVVEEIQNIRDKSSKIKTKMRRKLKKTKKDTKRFWSPN